MHSNVTAGLQCLDQKKFLTAEEDVTLDVVALLELKGNINVFNLCHALEEHSLAQWDEVYLEITFKSIVGVYFYSTKRSEHTLPAADRHTTLNTTLHLHYYKNKVHHFL